MIGCYPIIIVADRYDGTYSGGSWLAFNRYSAPEGVFSDDVECAGFWNEYNGAVGKGESPQEAYEDLLRQVK